MKLASDIRKCSTYWFQISKEHLSRITLSVDEVQSLFPLDSRGASLIRSWLNKKAKAYSQEMMTRKATSLGRDGESNCKEPTWSSCLVYTTDKLLHWTCAFEISLDIVSALKCFHKRFYSPLREIRSGFGWLSQLTQHQSRSHPFLRNAQPVKTL